MRRTIELSILVLIPLGIVAELVDDPDIGTFWHVTDFHYDENYTTSGDNKKMCWSSGEEVERTARPSGRYGDYLCDSPLHLIESTFNLMKNQGPDADFILWTGDDTAHVADSHFSTEKVMEVVELLTRQFQSKLQSMPLFPVLGNHDYYPKHAFPGEVNDIYLQTAKLWKSFVGDDVSTFERGAYYSRTVPGQPKLRIISLNTCMYYYKNPAINDSYPDPSGQFQWFEQTLSNAKAKNESVYVIGHIPPGVLERHMAKPNGFNWFRPEYNVRFLQLVVEYSSTIKGMFFGHQHLDSFRVIYDKYGNPVNWIMLAPAVTPWTTTLSDVGGNNPGVRLFMYDRKTGQVLTYKQYFLNLTAANQADKPLWRKEYDFIEDYHLSDMSPKSVNRLAQTFNGRNRSLFDIYYTYNSVSLDNSVQCNDTCKRYQYCAITCVDFDDFSACRNLASVQKKSNVVLAVTVVIMITSRWFF